MGNTKMNAIKLSPLQRAVYYAAQDVQLVTNHLYHLLAALAVVETVQAEIDYSQGSLHQHDQILVALMELGRYELLEVDLVVTYITRLHEL